MSLHAVDERAARPDTLPDRPSGAASDIRPDTRSDVCRDALPPESAAERTARHRARELLLERTVAAMHGDRTSGGGTGERDDDIAWLEDCLGAVAEGDVARDPHTFDLAFGLAPRRLGRGPLASDDSARRRLRHEADACLRDWRPERWRLDEATRVLLITAAGDDAVPALLARILRHADLGEQLALYRALPLLPTDADVVEAVRRGLRTNVRVVFEAIAHDNPWPARHLAETGWNQMVLKALFVESALAPIVGLDARANADLAAMLLDYARERLAAGRPVPRELVRALGPFATTEALSPLGFPEGQLNP